MLMQVISVAGAVLILTAFAAHQMERLNRDTYAYQLMNLFGGAALTIAAMATRQAGLILVEGAWTVISVFGLVKLMRGRS
jgi:hypothetical protein